MHYTVNQISFTVGQQIQGRIKEDKPDGVQTEIYHVIGDKDHLDHAGIEIVTITKEGQDYFKITTKSAYQVVGYKFPPLIPSTDKVSLEIIAKLAIYALEAHTKQYAYITANNPTFRETVIPPKSAEQLEAHITQAIKSTEIKPDQKN